MTLTLTIPAPCEPLNSNQRLHHHVKAKRTAAWRARAQVAAIQAGKPRMEHAHVRVNVALKTAHKFDAGNYYPTAKACLDGIVSAGCLPDDSNEYVIGPDMRSVAKADQFTLWITLDPACECVDCAERFGVRCSICGDPTTEPAECPDRHGWEDHCLACVGTCAACQHRLEIA